MNSRKPEVQQAEETMKEINSSCTMYLEDVFTKIEFAIEKHRNIP
jgi:hypothetical protein